MKKPPEMRERVMHTRRRIQFYRAFFVLAAALMSFASYSCFSYHSRSFVAVEDARFVGRFQVMPYLTAYKGSMYANTGTDTTFSADVAVGIPSCDVLDSCRNELTKLISIEHISITLQPSKREFTLGTSSREWFGSLGRGTIAGRYLYFGKFSIPREVDTIVVAIPCLLRNEAGVIDSVSVEYKMARKEATSFLPIPLGQ